MLDARHHATAARADDLQQTTTAHRSLSSHYIALINMASFQDLNTAAGLKELNEFLLTRSYIDGCAIAYEPIRCVHGGTVSLGIQEGFRDRETQIDVPAPICKLLSTSIVA